MKKEQAERVVGLVKGTLNYEDLAQVIIFFFFFVGLWRKQGKTDTFVQKQQQNKVDMVIEAVFESMEVKRQVFGRLDQVCKPSALLCSNTSTLDIDQVLFFFPLPPPLFKLLTFYFVSSLGTFHRSQIAASTNRPDKVIGTHFFSPAHIMKLLEIVKGKLTSADTIATTVAVCCFLLFSSPF